MKDKVSIFWFRRDLRLEDNIGLHHALKGEFPVLPIFIFDTEILNKLENKSDRRVDYIHQALVAMNIQLKQYNSAISTFFSSPFEVFQQLSVEYDIQTIFCNRDYEPYAIERDTELFNYFEEKGIPFKAFKDQVIFEKSSIVKSDGKPYTVFTPYSKVWRQHLDVQQLLPVSMNFSTFYLLKNSAILTLKELGFEKTSIQFETPFLEENIINEYDKFRDFPALQQTTLLGIALRFGTISVRKCVNFALHHNQTWLSELIWREFFMQILYHFPKVVNQSFKIQYDQINWRNDPTEFKHWCEGTTGYPIVDAGMRQLNETGFMHNRVRMVVASFLCKHLLIDWRWGEAYFAAKLNDYDLSANNGNWQWAAGSGCDAAPYFRIFNPYLQTERFDKNHEYIKRWLPELRSPETYIKPIVDHSFARARALQVYGKALK